MFSKCTPASEAIGLPRWSISDSSSSIVLFIKDVMLGMRALITASNSWILETTLDHYTIFSPQTIEMKRTEEFLNLWKKFSKIFWTHPAG
jgi:hypothetical protein